MVAGAAHPAAPCFASRIRACDITRRNGIAPTNSRKQLFTNRVYLIKSTGLPHGQARATGGATHGAFTQDKPPSQRTTPILSTCNCVVMSTAPKGRVPIRTISANRYRDTQRISLPKVTYSAGRSSPTLSLLPSGPTRALTMAVLSTSA